MLHDLDFAGPELGVRGVVLDCFTPRNPLCIRPNQRLGRVLAARAIIDEMVEMAAPLSPSSRSSGSSAARLSPPPPAHAQRHHKEPSSEPPLLRDDDAMRFSPVDDPEPTPSADIMISMATGKDEGEEEEDTASVVIKAVATDNQRATIEPLRDDETEHELMGLLDESLAVLPVIEKKTISDPTAIQQPELESARSASDEYEQSFDDDAPQDEEVKQTKEPVNTAGRQSTRHSARRWR
ncbi:hypothetical protein PINS_up004716 [Pythium insidiosum]|nr:hypothetical protein PINS_up004716 [Pythium insidiosum]